MRRIRHIFIFMAAATLCGVGAARADSYDLSLSSPGGVYFEYSTGYGHYGHQGRRHYYKDNFRGYGGFRHQPRYWQGRGHRYYRPWGAYPRRHYYSHKRHHFRPHGYGHGYWR